MLSTLYSKALANRIKGVRWRRIWWINAVCGLGAPVKQNRNETDNKTTLLAYSPYSSISPSSGNIKHR